MTRGRASRVAYNPKVALAYIDAHTTYERHGRHNRVCRLVAGRPVSVIESRTIRRWKHTEGITRRGLVTFLRCRATLGAFEGWALDQGTNPFIRNNKEIH